METTFYSALGERVQRAVLENGLPVVVVPRPGFTKKIAYFVTDFGSIHTEFTVGDTPVRTPAGIAHYLEHKLFDMPGGRDISAEFAAMGASVNAFTSYDMTAYYFSCSENFDACLRLLLEFVSTGWFTDETVRKEQGIIGQEIGMNEDSPDTRVFETLADAMYTNHPIRTPILGTRESIAQITPALLACVHDAFYRPENMLLCVIGDVDAQAVCEAARQLLPVRERKPVRRSRVWQEDMTVSVPLVTASMEVAMPMFQLGFKAEPLGRGQEAIVQEVVGDLAAEALFGESSQLYLRLYEQGLIDSSFGGGLETIDGMAMLTASGDSEDPVAIREAILARAAELAETGIPEEEFLRMKRSALGRRIRGLDSFDSTAFRICAYHFADFDYFRFPAAYAAADQTRLREFLARVVTRERCSLSVIHPIQQEV